MEFTVGDYVRMGFGFANPNHAAAAICALLPFLWGWTARRWLGHGLTVLLLVALSLTFSRTGFAVLALESAAWMFVCRKARPWTARRFWLIAFVGALAACAVVSWMAPRLTLDGAILNRPRIWLAGLRLVAANPLGVGFGNSGLFASSFLLPEGVEVRTLVNAHLTLLAETGVFWGGLWILFVVSAAFCGKGFVRARISFLGLALSACSSTVFDGHVLLASSAAGHLGPLNLVLSWTLLAFFVGLGIVLVVRGFDRFRFACSVVVTVAGLGCLLLVPVSRDVPRVASGYVRYGEDGPLALHDGFWSLRTVRGRLPEGACVLIAPGVGDSLAWKAKDVWLFGEVAESSDWFSEAKVTVVGAPEYYEPGPNVMRMIEED